MEVRAGGLGHPAVEALLALHRAEARASTPACYAHAMDSSGLAGSDIVFVSAWDGDALLGVGALKTLDPDHAELKSMRTAPAHLRRGVARAILDHLVAQARRRGHIRVSLETGTAPLFEAANRLYEAYGFTDCAPFGGYPASPHNRFMTLALPVIPADAGATPLETPCPPSS